MIGIYYRTMVWIIDIILVKYTKDKDKLDDRRTMVLHNDTTPAIYFKLLAAFENLLWSKSKALTIFSVSF